MEIPQPSLVQLFRCAFQSAKHFTSLRGVSRWLLFTLALGSLSAGGLLAYLLAGASLCAEVAAWWCGHKAGGLHALAEKAKRRAMLADALGEETEPRDVLALRGRFSSKLTRQAAFLPEEDYYASTQQPGPGRLGDHIEESAFWSMHLYEAAAKRAGGAAAIVFVVVLTAALASLPVAAEATGLLLARVFVVTLGAVVSIDLVGAALRWWDASGQCVMVLNLLRSSDLSDREPCLAIFSDYSVATATADAIPSTLYGRQKPRLNALWKSYKAQ